MIENCIQLRAQTASPDARFLDSSIAVEYSETLAELSTTFQ